MTPEQWYKIIYQKAVSLLEEEKNIYWGEKKQSERIKEQIQQIQDDYRNEKAKILNTKRELERFLDDAKNHYLNYIVLKPRNVENINMPSLKTLRLQIDDYSEYDPHARELYEYSLGGLELVNRVLSRLDKKQREEERRVGLNQVSDYKNRKETNKRRYFELLQSKEVEQLIECLKRVRRDSYLSNNFQYNPPQKEPSVFYIGQVAMPMPFPNYMSEEVRKRFGSFYDFSSCSLIFPKGFSTNTGGKVYITWENCDTRKWLNTEFYNEAFDEEEQKKIENTIVRIEDNYRTETEGGNDTRDKIFLLNIDQANNLLDTIDRETEGTEYVKKTYGAEGKQGWWLCSPGCLSDKVAVVRSYGGTDSDGAESSKYYGGIRPALWINSES